MCLEHCLGTHFQKGLSKEGSLTLNVGGIVPMCWELNVIKRKKEGYFLIVAVCSASWLLSRSVFLHHTLLPHYSNFSHTWRPRTSAPWLKSLRLWAQISPASFLRHSATKTKASTPIRSMESPCDCVVLLNIHLELSITIIPGQKLTRIAHVKFGDRDPIQNLPSAPGVSHGSIVQATSWLRTIANIDGGTLINLPIEWISTHLPTLVSTDSQDLTCLSPRCFYLSSFKNGSPKAAKHSLIPCVTTEQCTCRLSLNAGHSTHHSKGYYQWRDFFQYYPTALFLRGLFYGSEPFYAHKKIASWPLHEPSLGATLLN